MHAAHHIKSHSIFQREITMINETLESRAKHLYLNEIKRHIFLCCDQTKPKCCQHEVGLQSWEYLKDRLAELNLTGQGGIYRTKANCLRVPGFTNPTAPKMYQQKRAKVV